MRIGLDIGGTKTAAVVLGGDSSGDVVARSWREHRARGIDAVTDELAAAVDGLETDGSPHAVGVSVSGLVSRDGRVTGGASLDLFGDLAGALQDRIGFPVRVFNDGEATFRGVQESHRSRDGLPLRDAVLLTVGTGIGGAIVSDARAVRGGVGLATELGHLPVLPESSQLCVCGSSGCLEQYAGGAGIAQQARLALTSGRESAVLREHDAAPGGLTAKHVVAAAAAGDALAQDIVDTAAACLARAIRALCVTVEPSHVLLGGTVAHGAGDALVSRVNDHLARHWPFGELTEPPVVELDSIGPYAAAIGAARLTSETSPPVTAVTVDTAPEGHEQ